MLAYLDALVEAVTRRDAPEIERLLAHPLARILTRESLGEAQVAASGAHAAVPLRLLQLRHQTAQLLGDRVTAADLNDLRYSAPPSAARPAERRAPARQMELPLSA